MEKNKNWGFFFTCTVSLFFFFHYLIRFEPEQKVTIFNFIDCSIISYSPISFIPASSLNFYIHVRGLRGAGHPMYYGLVLDRLLG